MAKGEFLLFIAVFIRIVFGKTFDGKLKRKKETIIHKNKRIQYIFCCFLFFFLRGRGGGRQGLLCYWDFCSNMTMSWLPYSLFNSSIFFIIYILLLLYFLHGCEHVQHIFSKGISKGLQISTIFCVERLCFLTMAFPDIRFSHFFIERNCYSKKCRSMTFFYQIWRIARHDLFSHSSRTSQQF